jgi:hypothetical protein
MNAELIGIITVGIILLGLGIVIAIQYEYIDVAFEYEHSPQKQYTSSTKNWIPECYPSISPDCR